MISLFLALPSLKKYACKNWCHITWAHTTGFTNQSSWKTMIINILWMIVRVIKSAQSNHPFLWSLEAEGAREIELHRRDHAGDELQENEQCVVCLDPLPVLPHRVRHGLQHSRVLARVHHRHLAVLNEGELLESQRGAQVLLLDVLLDVLVGHRPALAVRRAEVHFRRAVVLLVYVCSLSILYHA